MTEHSFSVAYIDLETGNGSAEATAHLVHIANMLASGCPKMTQTILMVAASMSGCINGQSDGEIRKTLTNSIPAARLLVADIVAGAPNGTCAH